VSRRRICSVIDCDQIGDEFAGRPSVVMFDVALEDRDRLVRLGREVRRAYRDVPTIAMTNSIETMEGMAGKLDMDLLRAFRPVAFQEPPAFDADVVQIA
jgi:hypothetical protein